LKTLGPNFMYLNGRAVASRSIITKIMDAYTRQTYFIAKQY